MLVSGTPFRYVVVFISNRGMSGGLLIGVSLFEKTVPAVAHFLFTSAIAPHWI